MSGYHPYLSRRRMSPDEICEIFRLPVRQKFMAMDQKRIKQSGFSVRGWLCHSCPSGATILRPDVTFNSSSLTDFRITLLRYIRKNSLMMSEEWHRFIGTGSEPKAFLWCKDSYLIYYYDVYPLYLSSCQVNYVHSITLHQAFACPRL